MDEKEFQKYLFCFSCFLGLFFFVDMLWRDVQINLYLSFLSLSVGSLLFFGKLPCIFFHFWLPKAHVEAMTPRSVILAGLLLKFRLPFLGFLVDEIVWSLMVAFFAFFVMMNTKDFKVFVAYSSILHMTVYCIGVYIFSLTMTENFLVPHTLLSGIMFYFFRFHYKFFMSRSLTFFGFFGGYLLIFWLGIPFLVNFLVEFLIFNFLLFDFLAYFLWFFVFFGFLFLSLSFLSRSSMKKGFLPLSPTLYLGLSLSLALFWLI